MVVSALAAVTVGLALARFTGRSPARSAARQLGIATVAAGATWAVGSIVGVGVG